MNWVETFTILRTVIVNLKKVKIHKYCAYVLIATHHEIEKQDK